MTGAAGGAPERTFAGGVWSATGNAIWPLARLELLDWGVRVRGARGLGWLLPSWEARYAELTDARPVWAPVANRGVYLRTADAADALVFWTRRGSEILDHLQMHGVQADRTLTRLPWGVHAHHP